MTAATSDAARDAIQPPQGATDDFWTDAGFREVYEVVGTVETPHGDDARRVTVTLTARQYADGSLTHVSVEVNVNNGGPVSLTTDDSTAILTPNHAGRLAMLLAAAVVRADEWTAQ